MLRQTVASHNAHNHLKLHRDILNHVYFDKKKLYLAYLAHFLSGKAHRDLIAADSLHFAHFKGDERKPILQLTPNLKMKHVPAVRIYLTVNRLHH